MKVMKTILYVEGLAFIIVMVALWADEIFDLPHHLFRTPEMRFNVYEALFETFFLITLAAVLILITWRQTKRIAQLESLLPICSFCKKIRKPESDPFKQESWQPLELYIGARTGSEFSHGLCPECAKKHYGKYAE